MRKLYERSEIWFTVIWIIIYVMAMGTLRANFGDGNRYSFSGILLIAFILTLFILKNDLGEKLGFRKVVGAKKYLYFIPLILLMTVNFWPGVELRYELTAQVFAFLTMALVGYVEEILFRGFLFKAIAKDSVKQAIIISAITFGIGHIVNLTTGQIALDTILQVFYAIAIGFAFVLVMYKSKSIWPCVITHSVINMTSTISAEGPIELKYIISIFVIIIAGGYSIYLHKKC